MPTSQKGWQVVVSKTITCWFFHGRGWFHFLSRPNILWNLSDFVCFRCNIFTFGKGGSFGSEHHLHNASSCCSIAVVAFLCRWLSLGLKLPASTSVHRLHHPRYRCTYEHQGRERFLWCEPPQHWEVSRRGIITRFLRGPERSPLPLSPSFD